MLKVRFVGRAAFGTAPIHATCPRSDWPGFGGRERRAVLRQVVMGPDRHGGGRGQMARLLRPFGALEADGRTAQQPDELELSPQASLRRLHERLVFRAISAHDVVSRTQLAVLTGLSAQSIGRVPSKS